MMLVKVILPSDMTECFDLAKVCTDEYGSDLFHFVVIAEQLFFHRYCILCFYFVSLHQIYASY